MDARPSRPDGMIRQVPHILRYVVHVDSFLAMGALAVVLSVLDWLGRFPGTMSAFAVPLSSLTWGVYFFLVARKASIGSRRLPVLDDFRDTWDALILPLVRAAVASSWCWIVLVMYVSLTAGLDQFLELHRARPMVLLTHQGWGGHLLLTSGLVFLPVSMLAALVESRVLPLLDPTRGFRLVARLPGAFFMLFLVLNTLGVVGVLTQNLGTVIQSVMPIPLAAPVLSYLVHLWVDLAQARMLGGFAWHNRAFLGMAPGGRKWAR